MQDDETTPPQKPTLEQIAGWLKLTAKATRDLAEGGRIGEQRRRTDHQELVGLILACLPDAKPVKAERKRRDSDDTDSFPLPGGNKLELTKRTQKRIVHGVLVVLAFVGSHVANYFLLPHPERPAAAHASVDAVSGGSAPRIPVPALAPPRAP